MWVSSQAGGPALALRYPQIVMHAISRDPSSYAKPCIYLQLDEGSEDMMQQDDGDEEEEGQENGEEEEVDVAGEVRLVPADESKGEAGEGERKGRCDRLESKRVRGVQGGLWNKCTSDHRPVQLLTWDGETSTPQPLHPTCVNLDTAAAP